MQTTRKEEQVNELSIGSNTPKIIVEDGVYEAELTNFKIGNEVSKWGPKQFAKLNFKITKGQYSNVGVTYKGNFFQDQASGQWVIGPKSKLADAIKSVTNGSVELNRGHIGTRSFIKVKTFVSQSSGERYSLIESIIPMPRDYASAPGGQGSMQATPQTITHAPQVAQAPAQRPAPQAQPAQQVRQAHTTAAPVGSAQSNLLDDLTELSDYKL